MAAAIHQACCWCVLLLLLAAVPGVRSEHDSSFNGLVAASIVAFVLLAVVICMIVIGFTWSNWYPKIQRAKGKVKMPRSYWRKKELAKQRLINGSGRSLASIHAPSESGLPDGFNTSRVRDTGNKTASWVQGWNNVHPADDRAYEEVALEMDLGEEKEDEEPRIETVVMDDEFLDLGPFRDPPVAAPATPPPPPSPPQAAPPPPPAPTPPPPVTLPTPPSPPPPPPPPPPPLTETEATPDRTSTLKQPTSLSMSPPAPLGTTAGPEDDESYLYSTVDKSIKSSARTTATTTTAQASPARGSVIRQSTALSMSPPPPPIATMEMTEEPDEDESYLYSTVDKSRKSTSVPATAAGADDDEDEDDDDSGMAEKVTSF